MTRQTLALALLGIVGAPAAHAQAPSPAIRKILADTATAYRTAPALSMVLETGAGEQKTTVQLALKRPDKLSATVIQGNVVRHVVADGKAIYSDSSADKSKYIKQPGGKLADAVNVLAMNRGAGVGLLPILLTSPAAEKQIIPGQPLSVTKETDATVDGTLCHMIAAVLGQGERKTTFRFAIAKKDHFLRRLSYGPTGGAPILVENYSKITARPTVVASTFTYRPAPGAVASDPPKAPAMYDERLKVGADPFPLVGKDLAGNAVSYADFKGKVLLVDFWATWCGPCVAELPNVLEAYGKYKEQGFDILGISLDRQEDRAKLEGFIKERNMPWRQIYDGKFWGAANAVAYGVQSIPFTLLIGKDGKIAAVGVRGPALAPAIEAALKQ